MSQVTREHPQLCVVINNYNYAHHLKHAVESVLGQLLERDELLVVDDGSTDASLAVLDSYTADPRIKILAQANQGQLQAVLNGIKRSTGDVVLLLDSDDYYLPGYLDTLRQLYSTSPEIDAVFCVAEPVGENVRNLKRGRQLFSRMHYESGHLGSQKWSTLLFHEFQGTLTSGISMRTHVAHSLLPIEDCTFKQPGFPLTALMRLTNAKPGPTDISADGMLIRALAVLGANRYVENRPGFAYRIHDRNYFASLNWFGKQIRRYARRRSTAPVLWHLAAVTGRPSAVEITHEVENRSWPSDHLRRLLIRARYGWYILISPGTINQRLAGLKRTWGL